MRCCYVWRLLGVYWAGLEFVTCEYGLEKSMGVRDAYGCFGKGVWSMRSARKRNRNSDKNFSTDFGNF